MPAELSFSFETYFNLNEKNIIKNLYQSAMPNKYLAEFARFLFENEEHPFITKIIIEGMDIFIENHILLYAEELKEVPLHFVGSIAYHAQKYIDIALHKKGLKAASYIRRPIDNLITHIKKQHLN